MLDIEQLLERSIKAQEQSVYVSKSLLEVSQRMEANLKTLNDSFILHDQKLCDASKNISDVKNTLIRYLKICIIALLVAVGGTSIIKLLLDSKFL